MLHNPVREAGLGGFQWRDDTILDQLRKSRKTFLKASAFRCTVYALTAVASMITLWVEGGLPAVLVASALVLVVRFGRLDRTVWQGQVLYGVATLVPAVLFGGLGAVVGALWLALASLLVEGEVLLVCAMLVGALGGLHVPLNSILPLLVVVMWTGYGMRTNHAGEWLSFVLWGRRNPDEEPIRMPLGFHKAGAMVLKKALRTNNGEVSARHHGSVAERVTAQKLLTLPAGSFVFHDIPLPGADAANIDHLAVTPHGVFVIDTKLFAGRIEQRPDGSVVKTSQRGKQSLDGVTNQMEWARSAMNASLHGLTDVKAMVTIQRAVLPTMIVAKDKRGGNVAYVALDACVPTICKFPVVLDETQMQEIARELKPLVGARKPVYAKK